MVLASRLSRSLKVIGTDTDGSGTYELLLVIIHSNYSEISGYFGRSSQLFLPPPYMLRPAKCNNVRYKKLGWEGGNV